MTIRPLSHRASEHLEDLAYLVSHLRADPQTSGLAPDVETALAALRAQDDVWQQKHHAVEEAQAGLENADEALDNAARSAQGTILEDLQHNRRSPKFITLFPHGLSGFVRAPYADALVAIRALAERCAQDPSERIRELTPLLQAAADRMSAAFERRAQALVAEAAAYGQLQVQKLQAVDASRRAGNRLAELFPFERDRVRSFFRWDGRRSSSEQPVEVGAEAGADVGAAAAVEIAAEPAPARTGTPS